LNPQPKASMNASNITTELSIKLQRWPGAVSNMILHFVQSTG